MGDVGMQRRYIQSGEASPAVSHNRNIQIRKSRILLQRSDAIIQIAQRLCHSVRIDPLRLHTSRMIICEYQKSVLAEHFDLLHIRTVPAAKSVVEYDKPAFDRVIVAIQIAL